VERRAGCFELAQNGTVLLDEIGDMPLATQAKLLRVLEDGRVRRLGGKGEIQLDVRVIAATNAPLEVAMKEGRFREDLYYRLSVFPIPLPPLRQRKDDLPMLSQALLEDLNRKHGTKVTELSGEVLSRFQTYDWPGNVRELRNVIERALILEDANEITTEYLPGGLLAPARVAQSSIERSNETRFVLPEHGISLDEAELSFVKQAIQRSGGNQTRAAELLGISRDQLRYRLKKLEETQVTGSET